MPQANPLAESELSEGGPEGNYPPKNSEEAWLADHLRSKTAIAALRGSVGTSV